ncbi:RNA-binding domain-containing protein [Massilibacteroides sp.]|uniref:ATP-binding protein n=1 Tax=Massilibacteroides sp. TaxID=2034766 RepID=UPI0026298023|nr:RNA-binding domain-containing protein [Massilibacteroides sp.]MDD4515962.1 ATP-binding protein [Massilibacteroides sp.]
MNINDIIKQLNQSDERTNLEVKTGSRIDRSVMETVCAFSNEPGLDCGYIVLGIRESENTLFPAYEVAGITDPDKLQKDLATQCADLFNIPVRPKISIEESAGRMVLVAEISELSPEQKPLYFKSQGLPQGAYRRIGSTDQRCTEDDLFFFYGKEDSFDGSIIKDSDIDDIDYGALNIYKRLREKVNSSAEELNYSDNDLLRALNCIKKVGDDWKLTNTGLIVFGKKMALRRLMPMVRVDYIRLPGKAWVENPDERFVETLDMRGPIIDLISRTISTIADDLPKGFLLQENSLQAESKSLLPIRVLREAVVNAFIHRTYRVNQPIQILRYANRLEIINAGYSLKPEDGIGEPGSVNRNSFIASIFHDTNLAETKGTGFKTMQILMKEAQMVPPTFESNREKNNFTLRLLFHNFLGQEDLSWLELFKTHDLNDNQKLALIFVREVGAIDNTSYRQLCGMNRIEAGVDLKSMRKQKLLEQKNAGKSTYYLPTTFLLSTMVDKLPTMVDKLPTMVDKLPTMVDKVPTMVDKVPTMVDKIGETVPEPLLFLLSEVGRRSDPELIRKTILALCAWQELSVSELAKLLNRNEKYIKTNYIQTLLDEKKIVYTIPAMITHPSQKYKTVFSD